MPVEQTKLTLWVTPDPAVLLGGAVGLSCTIEQSSNGSTWHPIGGFDIADVRVPLTQPGKTGAIPTELRWRFREQVYRDDIIDRLGNNWTTRRLVGSTTRYYQMQFDSEVRFTFRAYNPLNGNNAPLVYSADIDTADEPSRLVLSESNSMALIGNFTETDGAGALTTGSRTSVANSLITIHGANWNASSGSDLVLSSNQAGTYSELQDFEIGSGGSWVNLAMSYNIGGTRAAGHTCSMTGSGNKSLSASEWSGIDATPNVGSNTGTSTGTAISDSITVGESAGIVMMMVYDGSATTFATNGGSQASETDENNDNQAQAVHYKVGQTGTPSIDATLGASRLWGVIIASFEEEATVTLAATGFPVVGGTVTQTLGTAATTTPVVNLPTGCVSGETICVLIRVAAAGDIGWPDGTWNELFDNATDASDDQTAMAWRKATGAEGSTITLSSASGKFAALAWRVAGATDPSVRAPEISTIATGASTTPEPSAVTPTGGTKNYLFGWIGGWEGEQTSPPASNPSDYSLNVTGADSGTAGLVATNCRVAVAFRQLNASSDDPGSWTISVSDQWTAYTVAFHPADLPPPPEIRLNAVSHAASW